MENLYYFNHGPRRVRNCSAREITFQSGAQGNNNAALPVEPVSFTDPAAGKADLEWRASRVSVAP